MSISRTTEVKSSSPVSFDDAMKKGMPALKKHSKTSGEPGLRTRKFSSMKKEKYPNTGCK